jgi:hypothetical protein
LIQINNENITHFSLISQPKTPSVTLTCKLRLTIG